jgi:nucleoside-diphosphate-sugar epimerase
VTVLVTGGLGYIGSRLIREIPDHPVYSGEEIRILDNFRQPRYHSLWDLPVYAEYDFIEGLDPTPLGRAVTRHFLSPDEAFVILEAIRRGDHPYDVVADVELMDEDE